MLCKKWITFKIEIEMRSTFIFIKTKVFRFYKNHGKLILQMFVKIVRFHSMTWHLLIHKILNGFLVEVKVVDFRSLQAS